MVLIIQLGSEQRTDVNEKYTDSDLCKVSLQMTELTNSSQGTVKSGTAGIAVRDTVRTQSFISLNPHVVISDGPRRGQKGHSPVCAPEITAALGEKTSAQGTGGVGTSQKTMAWLHSECGGISIISNVLISL